MSDYRLARDTDLLISFVLSPLPNYFICYRRKNGSQSSYQRLRPHWPKCGPCRLAPGRCGVCCGQRYHRHQNSGPPFEVRFRARTALRNGHRGCRFDYHRRQKDQGFRHQGSGADRLGFAGRGGRSGIHRVFHRRQRCREAPARHGEESHYLGPREERRHHHRAGRERLRVRPREAQHHFQRFLHHQLPGPGGEGATRHFRDREGIDDHDPQLYQRSEDLGLSRTRICAAPAPPRST